jgi:hypothetical protein
MIQKSRQELKQRNVVGVVLNAAKDQAPYAAYYGYGGYRETAART